MRTYARRRRGRRLALPGVLWQRFRMRLVDKWQEEREAAALDRVIAEVEPDPRLRVLFDQLARAGEEQAATWAASARAAGEAVPTTFRPSFRVRIAAVLLRRFGVRPLRLLLAAMKVRGLSAYDLAPVTAAGHAQPTSVTAIGQRHRSVGSGGSLRAAVFGVNDGLVSNASLVLGMAGATPDPHLVLLTGIAGLLAGGFSMAAGEYVSVRSQRELFEYQIAIERDELREYPEQEAEEMALIYGARGIPLAQAREMARAVMADPAHALDALAREELGLDPDALGSPWRAAGASFAAFAAGAVLPLVPFLLGAGTAAVPLAAGLAGVGLFAVGAALSLFTGRSALVGGLRMAAIGGAAGLATWAIGRVVGGTLG